MLLEIVVKISVNILNWDTKLWIFTFSTCKKSVFKSDEANPILLAIILLDSSNVYVLLASSFCLIKNLDANVLKGVILSAIFIIAFGSLILGFDEIPINVILLLLLNVISVPPLNSITYVSGNWFATIEILYLPRLSVVNPLLG